MVSGLSVMWSFITLRVSGGSQVDLCGNTERIMLTFYASFFVVSKFRVIVNLFRQEFDFVSMIELRRKKLFLL